MPPEENRFRFDDNSLCHFSALYGNRWGPMYGAEEVNRPQILQLEKRKVTQMRPLSEP